MEVKTYIVIEADRLFGLYGFKSVTMDDIAKQLGISKKTIYQHFEDKDNLISVLMESKLVAHNCGIKAHAEKCTNAVHEVFLGLEDINQWLNTLNPRIFYDLQKYHPKAWQKFSEFKEKNLVTGIADNLKRGIEEGLYRSDIKVDILTELRLSQAHIVFSQPDNYTKNKYTVTQVMIEVTQHFLYGICTLKGQKFMDKYKKQLINNNQD